MERLVGLFVITAKVLALCKTRLFDRNIAHSHFVKLQPRRSHAQPSTGASVSMSTPRNVRQDFSTTLTPSPRGHRQAGRPSLDRDGRTTESADPPSLVRSHRLTGGIVLAAIVGVLFAAANLPMQYIEANPQWVGIIEFSVLAGQSGEVMPTMSGWPLRYHVQIDHDNSIELRYWSSARLVGNVLIGLACMAGIVFLAWVRSTAIDRSLDPVRTKKRFDIGFAIGVVALPVLLLAPIAIQSRRQKQLLKELSRHGNVLHSAWLPQPLADQVPSGFARLISRIRRVQLNKADDSQLANIVELNELMQLDSVSGTFDASLLNQLSGHPHFTKLTLARQQIGKAEFDAIDRLPWLTNLSLAQSWIDPAQIARFRSIKGLDSVNMAMTNLPLSEIGKPTWSASVRTLVLSRPPDGQTGSLTIEGWPELKSLMITHADRGPNNAELRIKLSDLPKLDRLSIDRLQLLALDLKNLPRLAGINHDTSQINIPPNDGRWLPALGWYSELLLEDLPGLTELNCFARDLTNFRLRNVPNLQEFHLGSYLSSSFGGSLPQPVDVNSCRQWIAELGHLIGPNRLVLSAIPLRGLNLEAIVDNPGIRELHLDATGIEFDDIQQLASMHQLTSIRLGECEIRDDQMAWFLNQFPDLEELKINGGRLRTIHLQGDKGGGSRLRRIEVSRLRNIESLRIIDRPLLAASLRIEHPIKDLVLRNARGLQGMAMTEPWPANASVTGMRDLRWFAAGGRNVDDDLVDVLLKCPDLDQLTLAFPGISRDRLGRLGEFRHLTVLIIPGAGIDDDITSNWSRLQSLWEVNLDGSRVGVGTIAWLSGIESLRSVSLNNVPLDAASRAALVELYQVTAMQLRNCPLTTADALRLFDIESLEILDLSGCEIDMAAVVERASRSSSLKGLILQGAVIDESVLQNAFAVNERLAIDVSVPKGDAGRGIPADREDEFGVNDPGSGSVPPVENVDDDVSADVADLLQRNAPADYDAATKAELARRMSRLRLAIRRAQGTSMRSQSEDPTASTMHLHEKVSLEQIQTQRERGEDLNNQSLQLFATATDLARIDLDYLRRIVNPQPAAMPATDRAAPK